MRTLSDADVEAIAERIQVLHTCRFPNVQPDDMAFAKDLIAIYKETRSEVIKWLVRGMVYGALVITGIVAYFKLKGIK